MTRITRTRTLALAVAAPLALAAPAVASASGPSSAAVETQRQTIVQIAAGNEDFETLVKLVKAAGLGTTLSGPGPFTVFAPTDDAFAKVPPATLKALAKNRKALRQVLTYHVVPGNVPSTAAIAAARAKKRVKTVEGSTVRLSLRGGNLFVNAARVVTPDIRAKNGRIHVINRVIIPPDLAL